MEGIKCKKMKNLFGYFSVALMATGLLLPACNRNKQTVDIPDTQSIYSNISYLDSLVRSKQIDSIGGVNEQITATLRAYARRAQSPEDVSILDSLTRINVTAHDLLQFCNNTQTHLDLLEQDTRALENQYRSGKIKITTYTSALVENEQTLVDIYNQLSDKSLKTLEYLKNRSPLISKLSPLPMTGDQ